MGDLLHRFVTRKFRGESGDLPIYLVTNMNASGRIEVQTTFYLPKHRSGDYWWVDPSDYTTFTVRSTETGEIGTIVNDEGVDPDDEFFFVDFGNGPQRYSRYDFEIIPDSQPMNYNSLKTGVNEVRRMKRVSKQGVVQHLPIPPDVQKSIYSLLTGVPAKVPENKAGIVLQERLSRPRGGPGAGELETIPERVRPFGLYNKALATGSLPYGPSEQNFMGGKRKTRVRIGTQMVSRGSTRRSAGIFSRLYSPVGHLLSAGRESVGAVTNTAKGVVGQSIGGLDKIGRSVTGHANQAVRDVFSRKGGKRRARKSKTRKTKKTKTRKSKKSTRGRR